MRTFITNAESLVRQSPDSPWRISLVSPSDDGLLKATIGNGGQAEVGPRLSEVLSIIERHNGTYPCAIRWDVLDDFEDEFTVRMLNNSIFYVELEIDTYKHFYKNNRFIGGALSSSNKVVEYLSTEVEPIPEVSISSVTEDLSTHKYYLVGKLATDGEYDGVRDGDTIDIIVEAMSERITGAIPQGFKPIEIGSRVGIRLVGVQTPETSDHGQSYGDDKNSEYALQFKISQDEAYKVGAEAREYTREVLQSGDGYIVVDLDIKSTGELQTTYDRVMGVVYKTNSTNITNIIEGSAGAVVNLNKSLLVEKSTIVEDVPLAILYSWFAKHIEYSRFDVATWEYELGLKKSAEHENVGDLADKVVEEISAPDEPIITNLNPIDIRYADTSEYDNRLNWFKPYDDRMEEPELNLPVLSECNVRIGDVMLIIPPLSIQYNRMTTSEKIKTLRTKQSTIIRSGNTESTITLQLYFHDLDSINGYEWDNGHGQTYHMDGLRSLVAQFKKAPFLPIDNPYINEVLNIHDVALIDISVSTVPGFPNSLSATVRLAKFEIAPFMPQIPGLGWAINYPMLRWYYQEAMKPHASSMRTYLQPIDPSTCGEFNFLIADENDLLYRQKAIEKLRLTATPEEIVEQIKNNDSQIGRLISDGKEAQKALRQYNKYMEHKNSGNIMPDDPYTASGYYQGGSSSFAISPNSAVDGTSDDIWHGDSTSKVYNHKVIWDDMYGEASDIGSVVSAGYFAPYESILFNEPGADIQGIYQIEQIAVNEQNGGGDNWVDSEYKGQYYDNKEYGFFNIHLFTGSNQNKLRDLFRLGDPHKDASATYVIPATSSFVSILDEIIQAGKNAELSAQESIDEYNGLRKIAEWTEADIPLQKYDIDGLICTSINVMYQNSYAGANMPSLEGPTMQYLGGQDPQVQVTFEATEEAVQDLREILEEVDRYAREYRLGITSGFFGIENGLANLFGVQAVIPEHVMISTVPNFPGRFQVEATLTGFNKTQKRSETLEGISPLYSTKGNVGDVNLPDRHASNEDMHKQDNAVFEYRMRALEVYADLELPTYDELNAALPTMGADCLEYTNNTKAKFVDPDFYVATEWTLREDLRAERDKDQRMYFRDMLGVKMYTDSGESAPLNGSSENWDLLRKVDEKSKKINPRFSWDGMEATYTPVDTGGERSGQTDTSVPQALVDFVDSRENQRVKPTYEEWKSWGLSLALSNMRGSVTSANSAAFMEKVEKEYKDWLANPEPSQVEVYDYIYSQVDSLWSDYYFNDKKKTNENATWKSIAYSKGSVDIFMVNHEMITGEDPASVIEGGDPGGEETKIKLSDWESSVKGKIPRERLANLVKATFDYLSKWKQFSSGGYPSSVGFGTSMEVGIGRVNIAKESKNVDEARRFCYDWKYNLNYSINKLFELYKAANDSDDNTKKAAPWDWMIHGWTDPSFEEGELDNDFFRGVYSSFEKRYNSYDLRFSTAQSPIDLVILEREEGITPAQKEIIQGRRDVLIKELEAVGIKADKYKDAEKYSEAEVKEFYEKEMKEFFGTGGVEAAKPHNGSDHTIGNRELNQTSNKDKYPEQWANFNAYLKAGKNVRLATDMNNLANMHDPQELFKGMYTDMLDYDMRGRLVRAFPTFQMFIIDEGRWMTDYRLWDNMYGFNAIESIDVHKNRKIVADTAIVKMTNIYSNLTTRPLTENYGDWEYSFWSNLMFGNPSEALLDTRKELLTGMMLQTGARIHLRMGYGASVEHLPIVFNGTITEMDTDKLVTIVAQGDGIELTNVISGDPKDDNKEWGVVQEPRDTILRLMTSKGNWFKDAINYTSDGKFFKDNPLGIQHFGMPGGEKTPLGNVNWFNKEFGETAQNVYSSSGNPTFSQWVYGENAGRPWTWDSFMLDFHNDLDEMNIKMSLYNKTIWDIATTVAMCSPDYVVSVVPFELRSTLFFGKPYYQMAYRYDAKYEYDETNKQWIKYLESEVRKPFMQFHWYGNDTDIISNKIKASADNLYTNVIVNYGEKQSDIAYADWDIRNQYQKTTVVEAPIMPQFGDFWTSEDQARMYSYSAVKEFMKDMYQGSLVVLGDPSLKPHDMCYIGDQIHDMTGNFQVKDVTHSFSLETGFISTITPDAVVVNDDMALMNQTAWFGAASSAILTRFLGIRLATKASKKMMGKVLAQKHIKAGTEYADEYIKKSMHRLIKTLPKNDIYVQEYKVGYRQWLRAIESGDVNAKESAIRLMDSAIEKLNSDTKITEWQEQGLFDKKGSKIKTKGLLSLMRTGTNVMKNGKNAFWLFRAAGASILGTTPIGWIVTIGSAVVTETLAEMYRRKKANYQCVLMLPLKHQGRNFTAGINGHKGMVVGDAPGKLDNFLRGAGWTDGENAKDENAKSLIDVFDFLADAEDDGPRSVSIEELETGVFRPKN